MKHARRRTRKNATPHQKMARLLFLHWDLMSELERNASVLLAYTFGATFAEDVHAEGDRESDGGPEDYHRVCVKFSMDSKTCNDVEYALWESEEGDPRQDAFEAGFLEKMSELIG